MCVVTSVLCSSVIGQAGKMSLTYEVTDENALVKPLGSYIVQYLKIKVFWKPFIKHKMYQSLYFSKGTWRNKMSFKGLYIESKIVANNVIQ